MAPILKVHAVKVGTAPDEHTYFFKTSDVYGAPGMATATGVTAVPDADQNDVVCTAVKELQKQGILSRLRIIYRDTSNASAPKLKSAMILVSKAKLGTALDALADGTTVKYNPPKDGGSTTFDVVDANFPRRMSLY